MRDQRFDRDYFSKFIDERLQAIEKTSKRISNGEIAENRIVPMNKFLYSFKMPILLACYSRGDDIAILLPQYFDIIEQTPGNWDVYCKG